MTEHNATEQAYKNGYNQGVQDLCAKLTERYKNIPLWGAVAVCFMEQIVDDIQAENK